MLISRGLFIGDQTERGLSFTWPPKDITLKRYVSVIFIVSSSATLKDTLTAKSMRV